MEMICRGLLCLLILSVVEPVTAQTPIPELKERVTDLTGSLSASDKETLDQRLKSLEADTGAQMAILILESTLPETIEQVSIRLADQWKLGRKGIDDGAIVVIAKADRTLRIEVGRGLEGAIPDAIGKRIITEEMVPLLKEGDMVGALNRGVDAISRLIRGEALKAPSHAPSKTLEDTGGLMMVVLFLGLFVGQFLQKILSPMTASIGGSLSSGLIALLFGLSFWLTGILVVFVFLGILSNRSGGGGRWTGGSGGYGGFPGGGSDQNDSGYSGGGGGFSGGGASGHW
ncbi:MAG: TPM domain-containing protein [Methylococcus sp.]|jgi:uncharacterized protein